MGKRTWVDSDIWSDTDDLDEKGKLFYLYLLTNGQRNIAGYYRVNLNYMALDLNMSKADVERLLMTETKYWAYDNLTKQVLIPKFTRYNVVKSRQQISKMNSELSILKPCLLHALFVKAFEEVNGEGASELIDPKFKAASRSYIY